MEIIVDGKGFVLNPPPHEKERISEILGRVSEETLREHRLITGVALDGKPVPTPDDPALEKRRTADVKRIEITTEPSRKVAIRVLYDSGRHIPEICESLVRVAERIQSRDVEEGMSLLTDCLTAWSEVNQGLESACATVGVGYADVNLKERRGVDIAEDLARALSTVEKLMINQDYIALADHLEFETEPKLREIQELVYQIINIAERSLH